MATARLWAMAVRPTPPLAEKTAMVPAGGLGCASRKSAAAARIIVSSAWPSMGIESTSAAPRSGGTVTGCSGTVRNRTGIPRPAARIARATARPDISPWSKASMMTTSGRSAVMRATAVRPSASAPVKRTRFSGPSRPEMRAVTCSSSSTSMTRTMFWASTSAGVWTTPQVSTTSSIEGSSSRVWVRSGTGWRAGVVGVGRAVIRRPPGGRRGRWDRAASVATSELVMGPGSQVTCSTMTDGTAPRSNVRARLRQVRLQTAPNRLGTGPTPARRAWRVSRVPVSEPLVGAERRYTRARCSSRCTTLTTSPRWTHWS